MDIQFRDTVPNPAGGEWPKLTEEQKSAGLDTAFKAMVHTFEETIVPTFLAAHGGNVKTTAECVATLFIGFLRTFLMQNVEPGEKVSHARVSKATKACLDYSHAQTDLIIKAKEMGLPESIISAMLYASSQPDTEIKLRQVSEDELPQVLQDILDGKGLGGDDD